MYLRVRIRLFESAEIKALDWDALRELDESFRESLRSL